MPSSAAPFTLRRTASAPRLWPAMRGRPRAFAQRPLPSMMIATWTGAFSVPAVDSASMCSDLQDFLFLRRECVVDLLDVLVGQLLHDVGLVAMLVLGDL